MPDREPDEHPEPGSLDPAREARVRRLLGDARVDPASESLPPDVAARLEQTLATLGGNAAGASPAPTGSPVTDLTTRRRRRAAGLLLAAAAVVVAGVSVGQLTDDGPGAGSETSATADVDSATGADRGGDESGDQDSIPEALPDAEAPAVPSEGTADENGETAPLDQLVATARLRPGRFTDDVRALRQSLGLPRGSLATARPGALPEALSVQQEVDCAGTPVPDGVRVAVVYDGSPALLVLRPPTGGAQVADLVQCGTGETLRSTTLPER